MGKKENKRVKYFAKKKVVTEAEEKQKNVEYELGADAPDTQGIGVEAAYESMIIKAINSEWETIDFYNGVIANAREEGLDYIADVFNELAQDENAHVGNLQQLMKILSKNTNKIEEGEEEAVETIANPDKD